MNDTEVSAVRHRGWGRRRLLAGVEKSLLFAAAFSAVAAGGCRPGNDEALPLVIVSVPPQIQMVNRVAGSLVRVELMVAPGANPTTYEPTMRQMRAVRDAALYVKVGHPAFAFEKAWLDGVLAENEEILVADGSGGIGSEGQDPHLWLAPATAAEMIRATVSGLQEILPQHRELLAENGLRLLSQLEEVDSQIRAMFEGKSRRAFGVYHDAWNRFAEAYGLVQIAIEEEGKEPGAGNVVERIQSMRNAGVVVIFGQPQFSLESVNVIADEIGAEIAMLDPLASDWLENLQLSASMIAESLTR